MRALPGILLLFAASCSGPDPDPRSGNPYERYLGIRNLAPRHDAEAVAQVIAALYDPHYLVVIGAIEALAENGSDGNSSRIAGMAGHDHPRVRAAVCDALAALGNDKTVPAILDTLKDREASVRRASAKALASFGNHPDALRALAGAVGDRDASVSFTAHQSLRTLTGREDIPREKAAWERALP